MEGSNKIKSNTEKWRPVRGFPDYEISNLGRVKSHRRGGSRILKPREGSHGYSQLVLSDRNGHQWKLVHRLVLESFVDNPENKPECNHINGIKTDNRIDNLEWVTSSENMKHAVDTGLLNVKGENSGRAKLSEKEVLDMLEILSWNEFTQREIADAFGVGRKHVSDIKNGKYWTHLTLNAIEGTPRKLPTVHVFGEGI